MNAYLKQVTLTLSTVLLIVACSPAPATAPPPTRSFLQSRQELIAKYGNPASKKPAGSFSPGEQLIFTSDKLGITAELAGDACHFIRYTLPHHWTDEQISAALQKNGTGWRVSGNPAMALLPKQVRIVDYRSAEGHHARVSPIGNHLDISSARLVALSELQADAKRRKESEVPRF